jgi:hypothetical protein
LKFVAFVVVHFTALKDYIIEIVAMLATGVLEDFASTRPVDAVKVSRHTNFIPRHVRSVSTIVRWRSLHKTLNK